MSKHLVAFLLATSCVVCAALGSAAEIGVSDQEILIGNPNAKSGDNQFSGLQTSVGLTTYIDQVNSTGGINGRKIKVVFCDDKYTPDGAIECFNALRQQGVFALSGLVGSGMLVKYKAMATNHKVPIVGCYSGPQLASDPVSPYVFTVRPGYQDEEHQFVDHLWKDAGVRKFAIIYQNDAYGADHLKGIRDELAKYKTDVVAEASYERNSLNVEAAFNRVKDAKPEAVSLACNNNQCSKIIELARKSGWAPIFFVNSGANVDGFLDQVKAAGNGVLVGETVPSPRRTDIPMIARYQKLLKQYHPDASPGYTNFKGYITGMVLCEGLKRCGKTLTRDNFCQALETMHNWDIGLGKDMEVNYTKTDHFGMHKYVFGVVHNGDVVAVSDWKNLAKQAAIAKK